MPALLHHVPVIQNQNQVGISDGGEAVGDDKAGTVFNDSSHSFLQVFLQPGIHGGSGFIENQDLGRFENRPGNGQKLFFAL